MAGMKRKWLENTATGSEKTENDYKLLEIPRNGWKGLEMAGKLIVNGWKWLQVIGNG